VDSLGQLLPPLEQLALILAHLKQDRNLIKHNRNAHILMIYCGVRRRLSDMQASADELYKAMNGSQQSNSSFGVGYGNNI
jgi:hypothetical protein